MGNETRRLTLLESLGYRRPSWQKDALCIEYQDLPWHPERGQSVEACLQVCGRCAVRVECEQWAMADISLLGVLGGLSHKTRVNRRRLQRRGEA